MVKAPIEIGWVFVGAVPDWATASRSAFLATIEALCPEFDWRLQLLAVTAEDRLTEPTRLLDLGERELRRQHWDFVMVLTPAELQSVWLDEADTMPSRACSAAILSSDYQKPPTPTEISHMVGILGYLAGLDSLDGLAEGEVAPGDWAQLKSLLVDIADARLEEVERSSASMIAFTWQAFWLNKGVIRRAWQEARPWLLPFWLSGLSTAAFSALVVLIVTAEAWEVGTRLGTVQAIAFALVAVITSSLFLLRRQGLLISGRDNRRSELRIVTDLTTGFCVLTGMIAAWAGLFAAALFFGFGLFDDELVNRWTGGFSGLASRIGMAGLVASIGLIVGALGASFEGKARFRHYLHIDAEWERPR